MALNPRVAHAASPTRHRLYLSQVLDRPVLDAEGGRVGRVQDLVMPFGDEAHPAIGGLIARQGGRRFFVKWAYVAALTPGGARLSTSKVNLRPFERRDGEALLRRDILDKQLIDIDGRRVVRASDLQLAPAGGGYRLVGVDVSVRALLRRLGPAALAPRIAGGRLIDWAEVESFATDVPMVHLKAPHAGIARLHPVEIARIVEALSFDQGQEVLAALDDETAADTVQELAPDDAASHIGAFERERAADILDEMDPNEVADILGDLDAAHAADLLARMDPAEAADARELLEYDEDTAGGLMTTDFVALPRALTAGAAVARLRALDEPPDPLYHVYLIPEEGSWRLCGVVSLRALLLAPPAVPLARLGEPDYRTVRADERPEAVAHVMAEYDLPDLPVVDAAGDILGVVLIDDAVDVLYPDLWRRRRARGRR